jgi:hypothetical protein
LKSICDLEYREQDMGTATSTASALKSQPVKAILLGGFACGTLDITAALIVYGQFGLKPLHLLQGIAAGVMGTRALAGGYATALLGLLLHFLIAYIAAAVYVTVGSRAQFLVRHWLVSGPLYGVAVYFFMNRIVVPLSAARKYPFSMEMMIIGVIIHIFCVGLPIAFSARFLAD